MGMYLGLVYILNLGYVLKEIDYFLDNIENHNKVLCPTFRPKTCTAWIAPFCGILE